MLSMVATTKQSARSPFQYYLYLSTPRGHATKKSTKKRPLRILEHEGRGDLPGRPTALGWAAPGFSTVPTSSVVPERKQKGPQALTGPHHPEPSPSLQPSPSARGPQDWGPEVCKPGCGHSPFPSSPFQVELVPLCPPAALTCSGVEEPGRQLSALHPHSPRRTA